MFKYDNGLEVEGYEYWNPMNFETFMLFYHYLFISKYIVQCGYFCV